MKEGKNSPTLLDEFGSRVHTVGEEVVGISYTNSDFPTREVTVQHLVLAEGWTINILLQVWL